MTITTFDDILDAVDSLTPDQLAILQARIDQRRVSRMPEPYTPDVSSPEFLAEIRAFVAASPPHTIIPPTLPPEGFWEALEVLREGLTDEDSAEIEKAMNEEYIEPDDTPLTPCC